MKNAGKPDRRGQVWEHRIDDRSLILLVLKPDSSRSFFGDDLDGWLCLNLENSRFDWVAEETFNRIELGMRLINTRWIRLT